MGARIKLAHKTETKQKSSGESITKKGPVSEDSAGKCAGERAERAPPVTRKELLGVTQEWLTVD